MPSVLRFFGQGILGERIGYIMKANEGFLVKEVAGSFVIVPTGANIVDFSAMITINETGAFLWEKLQNEISEDELTAALTAEYDVDEDTARADVKEFVSVLMEKKVIK